MFLIGLLLVLGFIPAAGRLLPVFLASPYLNGFIAFVFVLGVLSCFIQLGSLLSSVSYIEAFAQRRAGHEFIKPPALLASFAAMLSNRQDTTILSTASTQTILDSVATRLDERRDLTRYIINLLIFLGLLGTFFGLATTVPAVVETIRSLAPQPGQNSISVFDNLMSGLEKQLGGMGTAFGSSLIGLAGSLVVGLFDLLVSNGQNRFFRELEEWLSSITSVTSGEGGALDENILLRMNEQAEMIREILLRTEARQAEGEAQISRLTESVAALVGLEERNQTQARALIEAVEHGQKSLLDLIKSITSNGETLLDADSRARLQNIDQALAYLAEELSSGQRRELTAIKSEISKLTKTLRGK